jgi:hypothetical protein
MPKFAFGGGAAKRSKLVISGKRVAYRSSADPIDLHFIDNLGHESHIRGWQLLVIGISDTCDALSR